jgi:hypothetical protein
LVEGGLVLIAHIGDLDGFMMDFDTGCTKITVGLDRISPAIFAEQPAMFFDE